MYIVTGSSPPSVSRTLPSSQVETLALEESRWILTTGCAGPYLCRAGRSDLPLPPVGASFRECGVLKRCALCVFLLLFRLTVLSSPQCTFTIVHLETHISQVLENAGCVRKPASHPLPLLPLPHVKSPWAPWPPPQYTVLFVFSLVLY
jgi:hypothetical protein